MPRTEVDKAMSVGELIAALQKADPDLPVWVTTDGRHGGGPITRASIEQGEWKYDSGVHRNYVLLEPYDRQTYEMLDGELTSDGLRYTVLFEKHEKR